MSIITQLLMRHEGVRLKPYTDTVGKLTIGVGRNLTDNGITLDEADYLLGHDIAAIAGEMHRTFPWFSQLDACRQDAMLDMSFNLGLPRFKGFQYMIAAMERKDWVAASAAMLDSKWAEQVGERAKELAKMVRTGEYQY